MTGFGRYRTPQSQFVKATATCFRASMTVDMREGPFSLELADFQRFRRDRVPFAVRHALPGGMDRA